MSAAALIRAFGFSVMEISSQFQEHRFWVLVDPLLSPWLLQSAPGANAHPPAKSWEVGWEEVAPTLLRADCNGSELVCPQSFHGTDSVSTVAVCMGRQLPVAFLICHHAGIVSPPRIVIKNSLPESILTQLVDSLSMAASAPQWHSYTSLKQPVQPAAAKP